MLKPFSFCKSFFLLFPNIFFLISGIQNPQRKNLYYTKYRIIRFFQKKQCLFNIFLRYGKMLKSLGKKTNYQELKLKAL
jgi:hypothetical protein